MIVEIISYRMGPSRKRTCDLWTCSQMHLLPDTLLTALHGPVETCSYKIKYHLISLSLADEYKIVIIFLPIALIKTGFWCSKEQSHWGSTFQNQQVWLRNKKNIFRKHSYLEALHAT